MTRSEKVTLCIKLIGLESQVTDLADKLKELLYHDELFNELFGDIVEKVEEVEERNKTRLNDIKGLTYRAHRILKAAGIETIGDLLIKPKSELRKLGCGKMTEKNIKDTLKFNYDIDW